MAGSDTATEYAEGFLPEDAPLVSARARAREIGCSPIGAGGGAALRLLATLIDAKSVIEIGTGTGVSGTWLLRGMRPDGVLTTIDIESEHQRLARQTFEEAGFASTRYRLICGAALEVLPRFNDGGYDLVLADALKTEYDAYLEQALRLLRPGGVVAFDNALWSGKVADPNARDESTNALRQLGERVRDDERLVSALLPVGDGLLVGVKRGE